MTEVENQARSACPICGNVLMCLWGQATDMGDSKRVHQLRKCRRCGHLFVDPVPSAEYLEGAYRRGDPSVITEGYVQNRSEGGWSGGDRWVIDAASRHEARNKLLDIGSANAAVLREFRKQGYSVEVVEPSPNAEVLEGLLDIKVWRNTFENCEFDSTYDVISAIDVIEHVSSPVTFLRLARRAMSGRGIIVLRFPNSRSLRCRVERSAWSMIRPLGHIHYFTPSSFIYACHRSGLQVVSMRSHDLGEYWGMGRYWDRFIKLVGRARVRGLLDRALLGDQLLVVAARQEGRLEESGSLDRMIR